MNNVLRGGVIVVIIVVNFCPKSCRTRLVPSMDVDEIPPMLVFCVAGCIGGMVGGLLGGVVKRIW